MRQLKGERGRTAAEVVMDDALILDDGVDLTVEERTDVGRLRKTKTERQRLKRASSRHRGMS